MRTPFCCEVAGLRHHWSKPVEGDYQGYIKAEPTNPVDSNAIAVYLDNGQMLGYIPADQNKNFRIWSANATEFKASIRVTSDEYFSYPYHASLKIVDDSACQSPIVSGKKVVISGEYNYARIESIKSILSSYGAIIGNKVINRKTDLVVYESSIETKALELKNDPEYHFQIVSIWELMQTILADQPHNEFYKKKVSVWYTLSNMYMADETSLLTEFLIESGAIISKYTKKETEIVIDEKRCQRKHSKDAAEAGKQVLFIEDIILQYRGVDISKPVEEESSQESPNETIVINMAESNDAPSANQPASSNATPQKGGCMSMLILLLTIPTALWLIISHL